MRASKLAVVAACTYLTVSSGFPAERSDPLEAIPGFELRLLDKTLPVTITSGGKVNSFSGPLWFYIPTSSGARSHIGELTEPNDLDLGNSMLPQPPAGIGLRALKVPLKKSYTLSDGRQTEIDYPVFIYFRRVALPEDSSEQSKVQDLHPAAADLPTHDQRKLLAEVAKLNRELTALLPAIGDARLRERIGGISRQFTALVGPSEPAADFVLADTNIH